jgi:hypothetical protein
MLVIPPGEVIAMIQGCDSSAMVRFGSELELVQAEEPGTLAISLQSCDSSGGARGGEVRQLAPLDYSCLRIEDWSLSIVKNGRKGAKLGRGKRERKEK